VELELGLGLECASSVTYAERGKEYTVNASLAKLLQFSLVLTSPKQREVLSPMPTLSPMPEHEHERKHEQHQHQHQQTGRSYSYSYSFEVDMVVFLPR
jgi:hypothetical protein